MELRNFGGFQSIKEKSYGIISLDHRIEPIKFLRNLVLCPLFHMNFNISSNFILFFTLGSLMHSHSFFLYSLFSFLENFCAPPEDISYKVTKFLCFEIMYQLKSMTSQYFGPVKSTYSTIFLPRADRKSVV